MVTDSELLMLIHEENEEALKILIDRYIHITKIISNNYRRCINYLGITEDEICNEGLKAIMGAINNYNEYSGFLFNSYVSKIIHTNIKNLIIRHNNDKNKLLDYNYNKKGIILDDLIGDNTDNPEKIIIMNERIREILAILKNNLSEKEYKIIIMVGKGIKYKVIGNKFNMKLKTVYNTVYRIRCKIDKIMNKMLEI